MTQNGHISQHLALIDYPTQAAFGRVLPKNKIYEHSRASTRLKELFVKQVEQVVWAYKLAPETLNLPARPGVQEIQILRLQIKTPDLHRDILYCIDQAIISPVLFELTFADRIQVIAAYKRPSEANSSRQVLSAYFATGWLPVDGKRVAMPVALHMEGLYEQLLHNLIPLPVRSQESLLDLVTRVEQFAVKQRELDKLTVRLAKEKQFNRKIAINGKLRALKVELNRIK